MIMSRSLCGNDIQEMKTIVSEALFTLVNVTADSMPAFLEHSVNNCWCECSKHSLSDYQKISNDSVKQNLLIF